MKRKPRWDKILVNEIRASYTKKFIWGESDCVRWSFSVVDKLVEETVEPPWEWSNKKEALDLLAKCSLKQRMTDVFGSPIIMSKSMRGDFVYYTDTINGETIGINAGDKAVFLSSKGGIGTRNITECDCAWSID